MDRPPSPSFPRRFLLLQGPHGPFYAALSRALRRAGADVFRVGFNGGDQLFAGRDEGYLPYRGEAQDWPEALAAILADKGITDVVCYGASRPIHRRARSSLSEILDLLS